MLEKDYQKAIKKLASFFLLNPVRFNGKYKKQKGPLTSDQLHFRLQNTFRKLFVLVLYYLTKFVDGIWSVFRVIPKITYANLSQPVHDINYSTFICPFESGNWKAQWKKFTRFECLKNKKSFLDEIKRIFHSFWRALFG